MKGWLSPAGLSAPVAVHIVNVSRRGMRILLWNRVEPGITVEVQTADAIFLGEVVYCEPLGEGFVAGVEIEHALRNLPDLQARAREFLTVRE